MKGNAEMGVTEQRSQLETQIQQWFEQNDTFYCERLRARMKKVQCLRLRRRPTVAKKLAMFGHRENKLRYEREGKGTIPDAAYRDGIVSTTPEAAEVWGVIPEECYTCPNPARIGKRGDN